MYGKIFFTISIFKIIDCLYLEAESNYLKPKLERNNIVNKGIWVRNKFPDILSDKNKLGTFIFRTNSMDVDHAQNNFDPFGGNDLLESPFMSSYFQRIRRSPNQIRKRRPRSKKTEKIIKNSIEDSVMIKSKIVSDLKPTSMFNEYPYEVAILLNNDLDEAHNSTIKKELKGKESNVSEPENKTTNKTDALSHEQEEYEVIPLNTNATISTDVPKRSKKYDVNYNHVNKDVNNYNFIDENNNTKMFTKSIQQDRGVFQKTDNNIIDWKIDTRVPDSNIYKVVPVDAKKSKSVTERGLIKIISMLTKTFKKIMKKHNEIKNINDKLIDLNHHFDKKVTELTSKFEDFDSKYSDMIQFNDKIKAFEGNLNSQKENFELKEKEIQNTFTEFQDQQKKFLAQQKQFYAIQKLMLAQNEKINMKQNLIAKTQSQISHRQNNFARILKKAKQIINENKTKANQSQYKEQDKYNTKFDKTVIPVTTTQVPVNTQAMKINLFSIPTKNKLENQDALIIKEKDDKQIDDLVYKYYFNNTFIDSLMKSKILNNYAATLNSVEIVNRSKLSKKKRNKLETTKMLPINSSLSETPIKRERRWINHFSRNKYKRLNRHRKKTTAVSTDEQTRLNTKNNDTERRELKEDPAINEVKLNEKSKSDPFMVMATNFCNEIGQNVNEQVLKWCVEKAIRRLKFMEMNAFTLPPEAATITKNTQVIEVTKPIEKQLNKHRYEKILTRPVPQEPIIVIAEETTMKPIAAKYTPVFGTSRQYSVPSQLSSVPSQTAQEIFFPDNDELESNLKQYELTPDTEGNVYYEGSIHMSDYGRHAAGSGTASDIMPGLMESNSKIDIDPMTFDIQAKRRAYVRRLNEDILNQMRG